MLTEISMRATGRMTRLMDLAYPQKKMEPYTRDTGKMTCSTVRALKLFQMVIVTRVATWMARNMGKVYCNGPMVAPTREISTRMTFLAKVLLINRESHLNRHLSVERWSCLRWRLERQQDGGLRCIHQAGR
jgi:hypothetical protein